MQKNKYFCVSDLHGTHPKELINSICNVGFEKTNPYHMLVVAGDITDGNNQDNLLIDCLKTFESVLCSDGKVHNKLIAIKGNHDILFEIGANPIIDNQ